MSEANANKLASLFEETGHAHHRAFEEGELRVRVVRNTRYESADETKIKQLIFEHTSIEPLIEYTEEIERSASGKITSVICNI